MAACAEAVGVPADGFGRWAAAELSDAVVAKGFLDAPGGWAPMRW